MYRVAQNTSVQYRVHCCEGQAPRAAQNAHCSGGVVNATYSVSRGPVRDGARTIDFLPDRAFFIRGSVTLWGAVLFWNLLR